MIGNLPLGPLAGARVMRGMMFSGFGGQPQAATPPYPVPSQGIGPDTPAPAMGLGGEHSSGQSMLPVPSMGMQAPQAPLPSPKLFGQGGRGWDIVQNVGDSLMMLSGNPSLAAAAQGNIAYRRQSAQAERAQQAQLEAQRAEWTRQDSMRQQDRGWQVEDRDFKANQPEYFMSGNDRVRFDPATGSAGVVYDGRSDAEEYAGALGLDPTTPEYRAAVQDYVLRGNGPTAFNYDRQLEGVRQDHRVSLRQMPTYAQANPRPATPRASGGTGGRQPTTLAGVVAPILAKMAAGKPLTPAEQSAWNTYQGSRGRGRGGASAGTPAAKHARGPDGRMYEARGGQWVPVK